MGSKLTTSGATNSGVPNKICSFFIGSNFRASPKSMILTLLPLLDIHRIFSGWNVKGNYYDCISGLMRWGGLVLTCYDMKQFTKKNQRYRVVHIKTYFVLNRFNGWTLSMFMFCLVKSSKCVRSYRIQSSITASQRRIWNGYLRLFRQNEFARI